MQEDDAPLVDTGRAEEYVVSALGTVTPIEDGWAEFAFIRRVRDGGETVRLVKVKLIAPVSAVGPAFDLCIDAFGTGILASVKGGLLLT